MSEEDSEKLLNEVIEGLLQDGLTIYISGNKEKVEYRFDDINAQNKPTREIRIFKTNCQSIIAIASQDEKSKKKIKKFIEESDDRIQDIVCLVHEWGHANSPDKQVTQLYTKAKTGKITIAEKALILDEEIWAWGWAKDFLSRKEFQSWDEFEKYRIAGMTSYSNI